MNIHAEKRRVADLAARYANDPNVTGLTVVMVMSDGTSTFHVTPTPDAVSKLGMCVGICGAAGAAAEAKMHPKQPSPAGNG